MSISVRDEKLLRHVVSTGAVTPVHLSELLSDALPRILSALDDARARPHNTAGSLFVNVLLFRPAEFDAKELDAPKGRADRPESRAPKVHRSNLRRRGKIQSERA